MLQLEDLLAGLFVSAREVASRNLYLATQRALGLFLFPGHSALHLTHLTIAVRIGYGAIQRRS